MKLFSQALEIRAIKTIAVSTNHSSDIVTDLKTDSKHYISSLVMSSVDDTYFQYPPCKAAYKRLKTIAVKKSKIIDFEDLVEDPALEEEFRDILKSGKAKRAKSKADAEHLIEQLNYYRKCRVIYNIVKTSTDKLKEDKIDVDSVLNDISAGILTARSKDITDAEVINFGKDDSAKGLFDQIFEDDSKALIKTNFKDFDDNAGGLPSDGVFLLAGTTSGGKSVLRMNLCKNFYLHSNLDTLTVSLEMNAKKESRRLLSALTGIDFKKFARGQITESEMKLAKQHWQEFRKHGIKNKCRYSIFCPTKGVSIQKLFTLIQPYGFKVIAIDYVSLLDGLDQDNQWRVLSEIVRQAKIFSQENNCLVIILVQLDLEDGKIRYSRGMVEHADVVWKWDYSKPEQRELHIIPMNVTKMRDGELVNFDLKEEFYVMRISDITEDNPKDKFGSKDNEEKSEGKKKKKDKSKEKGTDLQYEF